MLLTFAVTGAYPKASSVGNVMSEPEPTIVLTVPASSPTPRIANASHTDMSRPSLTIKVRFSAVV